MVRLAPSPTINSVRYIAGEVRRHSTRIVAFQLEIRFELRDFGPMAGGVRGVPPGDGSHHSFNIGCSGATSRLVIVGQFSMGTPNTWRDCRLSLAALE
jgi:hypothetical protein